MHKNEGHASLMNISREQIISRILCGIQNILVLRLSQPQYVLSTFLNFGHLSVSRSLFKKCTVTLLGKIPVYDGRDPGFGTGFPFQQN